MTITTTASCPICRLPGAVRAPIGPALDPREVTAGGAPDAEGLRPSSARFGEVVGPILRCAACNHRSIAIDDGWTAAERDRLWTAIYQDAVDAVTLDEAEGQHRTAAAGLEAIERFVAPGRLLDVGCWTGSFLEVARSRGWKVSGVEPSRWAADCARALGLDVHHGTLTDGDAPMDDADAIVFADVLEHLWDPAGALRPAKQRLRPGGVVFITVPNAESFVARILGRRWWSVLPMHVQYFTRTSLARLLEAEGFTLEHVATHAKTFTVGYYADRLAAFLPPLALLRRALPARLAHRLVSPDFRDRLLVVARA